MQGFHGRVYYDATPLADTPDTATWLNLGNVRDATPSASRPEIEAGTRDTDWEACEVGKLKSTVAFELKYEGDEAGYEALRTAYEAADEIALAFMDRDITEGGSRGLAGNWAVTEMSEPQPVEGLMVVQVTVRPESYTAFYLVPIAMDNAVTLIEEDGAPLNLTGEGFGTEDEGEVYVTDNGTWGDEVKKNLCVVNTWAADAIGALANMTGFAGAGETAYAWVVTARGVVSANPDAFTYELA